jgi:uncharacterized membrane protein HdeD (DUF308 family)
MLPAIEEGAAAIREAARYWWLYLLVGIAWLVVGWVILTPDISSLAVISTLAGLMLLFAAADEFMTAFTMRSWRWLHGIFAVLFLLGGIYALLRPLDTFLALAALVGWFLLFSGTFKIVTALAVHGAMPLWWVGLIAGIVEVLIGFWAIGYPGRSIWLLIIWVGILALMRGITEIVTAFQLKRVKDEFGSGGAPLPAT